MKNVLKKGWGLFVTMVLIAGLFPMSTMAEGDFSGNTNDLQQNQSAVEVPMADENGAVMMVAAPAGETALPMTNVSAFVFENGQTIWLSNAKEDVPMEAATSQSTGQLKEAPPQNAILNAEIQTDSVDNAYEVTDVYGGVKITKYTGAGGDVVVPATLNGKMVLEIGESAFKDNDSLTSITLPEGLKKIGREAFMQCGNIIRVSLPESLEAIDGWAFAICNKLTSISLPQNLSFIGDNPFNQCHNLTSISVSPLNPNYQVLNGLLVDKTGKTVIVCPGGAVSANIPEGITAVGDDAFLGCLKILNIDLPESVISIGNSTFFYSGLTSINLPKGIAAIGSYSFAACDNLTSITVAPDNASFASIDGLLFDKDGTTLIACPGGKTSVMLPISVTDIGSCAFYVCDKLTVINIPENVKNIGYYAFGYCRSLTNLVLPEGVTEIGDRAFQGCNVLTRVVIPASVTKIGTEIFSNTPLGTIYGVYGSYAETYANANSIPFVGTGVPTATLQSIAITSPAQKLIYQVGEALDLTGLSVIGTYSDGTARQMAFTSDNILGFDSSYPETNQVLTIAIEGITTTYTVQIIEADEPGKNGLVAFLLKDVYGNLYEYDQNSINLSYVTFQINPNLPNAKMYQHFSGILTGGGKVYGLKDGSKGYMDYEAAVSAFMAAQFSGKSFDMNAYLALDSSKKLIEPLQNIQVVDKDGTITGIPSYTTTFYPLLTPGMKMIGVVLNTDIPTDYRVAYNGIELVYDGDLGFFKANILSTISETLMPIITKI